MREFSSAGLQGAGPAQAPAAATARALAAETRQATQEAAQELRAAAQEAAQEARQTAQEAAQEARQAAQGAEQAADAAAEVPAPNTITVQTPDGRTITVDAEGPPGEATAMVVPGGGREWGDVIESVTSNVFGSVVGVVGLVLTYKLLMKWLENRGKRHQALPDDTAQRLMRMEATIDSMAVEIERISEGQRFTSRLLADRTPVDVPRG